MDKFNESIENIKKTLGEENSALISDDLINIMSEHSSAIETNKTKDEEITSLKKDKEDLVVANSKLFQRLGEENNQETTFSTHNNTEEKEDVDIKIGDIINDKGEIL